MRGRAFFVDGNPCPYCGKKLDATSNVDGTDKAPNVGDYSVCIGCGGVLVFEDRFKVREPTAAELEVALQDDTLRRTVETVLRLREQFEAAGRSRWVHPRS